MSQIIQINEVRKGGTKVIIPTSSSSSDEYEEDENPTAIHKSFLEQTNILKPTKIVKGDYDKFVFDLPESFEEYFEFFDKYFIAICQFCTGNSVILLSKFMCIFVSIEFCVCMPVYFYIIGEDWIALKSQYAVFFGSLFSQVMKRFIYRRRPVDYNPPRAKVYGSFMAREQTSSFPCRHTMFSVLNAYLGGVALNYYFSSTEFFGWGVWMYTPILILFYCIYIAFCRVNLGVQHPSDCVMGIIVGGVVIIAAEVIFYFLSSLCLFPPNCYSDETPAQYDGNIIHVNYFLAGGLFAVLIIMSLIVIVRPIEFYTKFHFVFGIIFACFTFNFVFICKKFSLNGKTALHSPATPMDFYTYIFAAFFPCLLYCICAIYRCVKKWKIFREVVSMFLLIFVYISTLSVICVWRGIILS